MTKLSKILNIVLYVLLAITLVFSGLYYFGGEIEGQVHPTPVYTDLILNWGVILVFVTAILAIVFEIFQLITHPRSAIRSLISILALAVVVFVAYTLGDATPLSLPGYTGPDNVPAMLLLSDTFLYSMYFLFGIAIAAILYTELSRLFR